MMAACESSSSSNPNSRRSEETTLKSQTITDKDVEPEEKFKYLGESDDFYQIGFHGHHL